MGNVEIKDCIYIDGVATQIISGAMHYFRIVPDYWRDRLEKLKALGCNAVETYIPWNMHEPSKGIFCFNGMLDIRKFVQEAQNLDLYVILRPSPYTCGEWEFGGLPAWLLKEDSIYLRSCDPVFLRHVEEYYQTLMSQIVPLQYPFGGSVILIHIENEYGYYGSDQDYLNHLKAMYRKMGVIVPLVTSDGPERENMICGSVSEVQPTVNYGTNTNEKYEIAKSLIGDTPFFCMEFWVGWFDHWGNGKHMTCDPGVNAKELDLILSKGNVNFYMFHGGTNFGFMNGANYYDELTPDVTSYDYDAILSEDGELTPKYHMIKNVISKYKPIPEIEFSTSICKIEYGEIHVQCKTGLFESIDEIASPVESIQPLCMEKCGQNYGYILYESKLRNGIVPHSIQLLGANDRVKVYFDETLTCTLYDRELLKVKNINASEDCNKISILVENMGRVNYGPLLNEQRKGIDKGVLINGRMQDRWSIYPLPLENINQLSFSRGYSNGAPAFYKFTFVADKIGDTFLDFNGWGKGCAFINGFNIGRFWEIGPQKRLYVPGPLLRIGINEIIIFETEGKSKDYIFLSGEPDLG